MFAWEDRFAESIQAIRSQETKQVRVLGISFAFVDILYLLIPSIVAVAMFIHYILAGNSLTPSIAFSCFTLLVMIMSPLTLLGAIFTRYMTAMTALERFQIIMDTTEAFNVPQEIPQGEPQDAVVGM